MTALDAEADTRARGAAGCYRLEADPPVYKRRPWLNDSTMAAQLTAVRAMIAKLDSAWLAQDTFPLPRLVRLSAKRSTVPAAGRYALAPQPQPGSGYYAAAWGGSRDTLRLYWTMHDRMFSPVLRMTLVRSGKYWNGEARLESDERSLEERFYRVVRAERARCP